MRVAGVDACRNGWVAVALAAAAGPEVAVRAGASLAALLAPWLDQGGMIAGIDMPLGLLEKGWREAGRAVTVPAQPQRDRADREIAILY